MSLAELKEEERRVNQELKEKYGSGENPNPYDVRYSYLAAISNEIVRRRREK